MSHNRLAPPNLAGARDATGEQHKVISIGEEFLWKEVMAYVQAMRSFEKYSAQAEGVRRRMILCKMKSVSETSWLRGVINRASSDMRVRDETRRAVATLRYERL